MALPIGLNDLAKLTLLASDASYFDTDLRGSWLAYLRDTAYGIDPQYSVPQEYKAIDQWVDESTGFGVIVYKKDGATPAKTEIIVALRGTDGLNPQDWVANSQYLGWNQWNSPNGRARVFNLIDSLRSDPSTPGTAFEGSIHFTGQSLGGGLAQYAAYEYVLSHQGLTGFSKANITLTTFNGFGGVLGLQQNGGYLSSVLDGIGANAHFYTEGDLVSRLGMGHTGGTTYFLNAHATEVDPDTGEPFLLNLIDAHRIETGFYPFLTAGTEFEAAVARPIEYLPMQQSEQIGALFGRVFNDQDVSPLESKPRLVAGLAAALTLGPPEEKNALAQAVFTNLHSAKEMSDEWYVRLRSYDWGSISSSFGARVAGAAIYYPALVLAVLSDAIDLSTEQRAQVFEKAREWISNSIPTVGEVLSPEDRRVQMDMLFSLIPGAAIGSKFVPVLQPLAVDVEEFAQRIVSGGTNWVRDTFAFLREQAQGTLADTSVGSFVVKLASIFSDAALSGGMAELTVQGYLDSVIVPMIRDTANGLVKHKMADIAQQPFDEEAFTFFDAAGFGNLSRDECGEHALAPVGGEIHDLGSHAGEGPSDGGGCHQIAHGLPADEIYGACNGVDLLGETIEGAVDDFKQPGGDGRIELQRVCEVIHGRLMIVDDIPDTEVNFREGKDIRTGLDKFLRRSHGGRSSCWASVCSV